MNRRGVTLVEVIVYAAMLGVFLSGLYSTVLMAQRFYSRTQAQSDALAAALTACNQLARHLAGGAGASFVYQNDPPACALLSAQSSQGVFQVDSAGHLEWQKWVGFYLDAPGQRLLKVEQAITPTVTLPGAPGFASLLALPATPVASHIVGLNLTQSFPSPVFVYQVTSEVRASHDGQPQRMLLEGHFGTRQ